VATALRTAAVDSYYHSIRLIPANVTWGLAFLGLVFLGATGGLLLALTLAPLLGVPLVGIARLATLIVRGEDVVLSDAWAAWRRFGPTAILAGAMVALLAAMFGSNLLAGLGLGGAIGGVLVSLAGWGLVVVWLTALPFWLLLADPARERWSIRDRVKLTAFLLLAHPVRLLALGVVLALLLLVSAVLVAALFTVSVAYASLVAAHVVLPAADRLTAALGGRLPSIDTYHGSP
jgi:uncharacterized membrane protein YesL